MANDCRFLEPQVAPAREAMPDLVWPDDPAEVPDWVYTDRRVYDLEQERIFRGRCWNYVALEAELPKPGDYIRSYIGGSPIVVARDADGSVHAFENRCAHRGVEFCKTYRGNTQQFVCPYHQWTYDLTGALVSVPFRRGLKGQGGMPRDFRLEEHGLRSLRVATRGGVVFASFSDAVEPLEAYLGPEICSQFDSIFDGRALKILGVHRNTLPGNWKLYPENLKDPYHATLLHTYLTTFGLFVAGNRTMLLTDALGRHSTTCNQRPEGRPANDETKADIKSYHAAMQLADPRVIEFVRDHDSSWTSNAMTIWPNLILLRQTNILGMRQVVPMGPDQFMLIWTTFGYAEDSEEMTRHRLRQNNIFGPGGFLGIDDHEALKFVHDGISRSVPRHGIAPLGRDDEPGEAIINDKAIRGMYRHYRDLMGF